MLCIKGRGGCRRIALKLSIMLAATLCIDAGLAATQKSEAEVPYQQFQRLFQQGRYSEAIPLAKRALAINEKSLGPHNPNVAISLEDLAVLYMKQGRYADAEPLLKRSLAISEKALGPDHPEVATVLNNLGSLYDSQGHYSDAEPLFKRSLAIWEKALGTDHLKVGTALNNLGSLYGRQGHYAEPSRSTSGR